jgi:hypothetical protein
LQQVLQLLHAQSHEDDVLGAAAGSIGVAGA